MLIGDVFKEKYVPVFIIHMRRSINPGTVLSPFVSGEMRVCFVYMDFRASDYGNLVWQHKIL